jgi:hypothetical protein
MIGAARLFAVAACLLAACAASWGYVFNGMTWPTSRVVMHLQLGASGRLSDGSASWNVAAEDALGIWNQYLRNLQFSVVRNSSATPWDGDEVNNVFFSSDLYGSGFGDAVAVTTSWSVGNRRIEADTVFNANLDWNSYRGDLKSSMSGDTVYDLRRVALHEFGHTLGLSHPDERGQNANAIMNSHVSDVDHLLADDIRGGQALYGVRPSVGRRATFTKPAALRIETAQPSYVFRGTADSTRVRAVYLVNSRLGARRFFKATGLQFWTRRLSIVPGRNVISLYVLTPDGARVKVAQCVVTR